MLAFAQRITYIQFMREVNIGSVDLNLLIALKALLDERHVTRAAEKAGLSQPAMSRALGRLRLLFKDPLLVRGAGGMVLTARAMDLQDPLQNILSEIGHIISTPTLEPSEMQGELIIATRDFEMASVLPQVIRKITAEAPGLSLRIVPLVGDDLTPLEQHQVDFVIAGTDSSSASLSRKVLFKDNFVCLVSADNPIVKQKFTLEKFLAMRHCMVTITDFRPGVVDTYLAQQGKKRVAAVRVPHFLAASYLIEDSDFIVTLPRRLGLLLSQHKKLAVLDLPFLVPGFSIYLYWHNRNQNNPVHMWMRKMIKV